ncbi:site-2 protease family protein [Streptomyces sp. NPDC052042]|uniref:site-2 protease family protein n=1 Tax=Streptomyces sp. NPDC052042 TaxID=3365683 RepID=UPI0037CE8C0D
MMTVLLYVLGVLIFLVALFVSIALHELGHLSYAKKFGCRVSHYMVGFGPTVWSRTKGDTEYGIKLIPLGGYVKIIGMFPPETDREHSLAVGEAVPEQGQRQAGQAAESAPAGDTAMSSLEAAAVSPAEGTGQAAGQKPMLRLRKSNTGLFAQMVSQTRAAEFELVEPGDADRLFCKLPPTKKILVMLAGPAVNIAIAFACFCAVFGLYGIHETAPTGSTVVS